MGVMQSSGLMASALRYSAMAASRSPLSYQSDAEVVMGLGNVGLDGQRLAVLGDGGIKIAFVVSERCRGCHGVSHRRA